MSNYYHIRAEGIVSEKYVAFFEDFVKFRSGSRATWSDWLDAAKKFDFPWLKEFIARGYHSHWGAPQRLLCYDPETRSLEFRWDKNYGYDDIEWVAVEVIAEVCQSITRLDYRHDSGDGWQPMDKLLVAPERSDFELALAEAHRNGDEIILIVSDGFPAR